MQKALSTLISVVIFFVSSGIAQTSIESRSSDAAKIAAKVREYSSSKKRVVVENMFGDETKGVITSFDDDKFTVTDSRSGRSSTFEYGKVRKISKSGGLSAGAIVALVAAGAGAAVLIGLVGARCRNEGGC